MYPKFNLMNIEENPDLNKYNMRSPRDVTCTFSITNIKDKLNINFLYTILRDIHLIFSENILLRTKITIDLCDMSKIQYSLFRVKYPLSMYYLKIDISDKIVDHKYKKIQFIVTYNIPEFDPYFDGNKDYRLRYRFSFIDNDNNTLCEKEIIRYKDKSYFSYFF